MKFQTVDRHNAGQPIAHATTHGARTTARHRVKEYNIYNILQYIEIYYNILQYSTVQ